MVNASLAAALRQVCGWAARYADHNLPDHQLLERFAAQRDEAAFTALVRRHGGLVLGVARRILRDAHAAEDIFQNTFLTLARRAGSIRKRESLASWLYGVAARLASQTRLRDTRRSAREREASPPTVAVDVTEAAAWRELGAVLDEELQRLPEKYRTPLVHIYFAGQTQEEAARQLGWSKGTLRRRLERGKRLLHDRLSRRGVSLSVGLLATGVSQSGVEAALPPLLVHQTITEAVRIAALGVAGVGALSHAKMAAALMLAASVLAAGTALLMRQVRSDPEDPPSVAAAAQPKAEEIQPARKDRYGDDLPPDALARFGTVRFRQGNSIYALDLSPDGRRLITVGGNSLLHLWDVATGKEVRRFPEERRPTTIYAAVFSPDGRTFATGGYFGFSLWQTSTGKRLHNVEWSPAYSLAFAPDGKTLATGTLKKGLALWDVVSGKKIAQLEEEAANPSVARVGLHSLAFAPNGRLLASTYGKSIILWDVATRREVRRLEGYDEVHTATFSPDGKLLASGSADRTIRLWDAATGRELRQLKGHEATVTSLVFSADGKTLFSGSGWVGLFGPPGKERRALRLWDVASGEERGAIEEHGNGACSLALSRNGTLLAAADGGCVRLWDPTMRREVRRLGGHRDGISGVAFSPDGKSLVTGSGDSTLRLWDAGTGRERRTLACGETAVYSAAFSPTGRLIAGGYGDGVLRLWDASSGREIRRIRGHPKQEVWVGFSPDGTKLASAGRDATAALWDVATGRELRRFKGDDDGFLCVAFSPDGKQIAAGELFGKQHRELGKGPDAARPCVRVWDVTTGKQIHALQGHKNIMIRGVAFSPDGTMLASIGWDKTCLWNATTGQMVGQLPVKGEAVAFSPDGRTLATGESDKTAGTYDYTVRLWEVATRKERMHFLGHRGFINSLAFAPDGRTLASGSADSTALLWDLTGRLKGGRLTTVKLSPRRLAAAWDDLSDADAARAYRAIWTLTAAPEQAPALLRQHLRPAAAAKEKRLMEWIKDLDHDQFSVREKAVREVQKMGPEAEPALRKLVKAPPSLESRRRAEQILEKISTIIPSAEQVRTLRGLEVLEHLATVEAREMLEELSRGAPDAWLTHQAKTSLARLARRLPP